MMKTLRNALDVLEFVAANGGLPTSPSAAAQATGLNLSSCTRIMQTLVSRGYLVQQSRRGGYQLGPAAATYGNRPGRYSELVDAAREPMRKLAREVHAMVNLSVIHNDRRYILYQCGYTEGVRPASTISMPWNYLENATERLLLSAADHAERQRILRAIGLPDGFASEDEFLRELDRLAAAGTVKFYSDFQKHWIVGGLMAVPGYPTAALGLGVATEPDADRAIRLVHECAGEICRPLAPRTAFAC